MKKLLTITALAFLVSQTIAQPFGNEWINYNQKHLKFQITKDGLYRINYNALNAALVSIGESPDAIDHRNYQLFGRGQEIYIYIEDQNSNNNLNQGDYIEFYAEKNTGWYDTLLYQNPADQGNPFYSLFNDTATYYLTWNNSTNNNRYNEETDVNFSSYTAAPFCLKEVLFQNPVKYAFGALGTAGKQDPYYTAGEGWFDTEFNYLGSKTYNLATPNRYSGGGAPDAILQTATSTLSDAQQNPDHRLIIKAGVSQNTLVDVSYNGYELKKFNFTLPVAEVGNGSTTIRYESGVLNPAPASDKTAVTHAYLTYAHTFDFEASSEFGFIIPANGNKTYLDVSNFTSSTTNYLYDLTDNNRIPVVQSGTSFEALVPIGGEKKCFIASENQITNITTLQRVSQTGFFTEYSTLNVDSAYIILTHTSLLNEAQAYESYRQSIIGQSFNTLLIDVEEQLYDQYAFGIQRHPLAIRNFADDILTNWNTKPKHLFLIGKSIASHLTRKNSTNYINNILPAIGTPATDILFTSGLNGTTLEPAIPTGRLAAQNPTDVQLYLSKVQEFEANKNLPNTIAEREWMKQVLHFGGGANSSEQSQFKSYLNNYETTIEDTCFGGNVTSFFKSSSEPIQNDLADSIKQMINSGVSLMTFFGHASGSSFDISIDNPATYNNKGKYPLLIANSCFAGDIHLPVATTMSNSEEFVLIQDKGVIGFLSSVNLGFASKLNTYTNAFYKHLSQISYGTPIGELMQKSVADIQNVNDFQLRVTCLEMGLHGDPAIILNAHKLPDFALAEPRVYFNPEEVTNELDSFDVIVEVTNIGKGVNNEFEVQLTRKFPNNTPDSIYLKTLSGVHYKDSAIFTLPIDELNGIGINQFDIQADLPQIQVAEADNYINNRLFGKELWILSTDLIPIYPYNYAVIPTVNNLVLKASTADPFAPSREYKLELDTTDLYNSSVKMTTTVTQSGGVVEWPVNLPVTADSISYFWRASPVAEERWREFTFQYIPDKYGWGQDHFFQFKNDAFNLVDYNRNTRTFDFANTLKQLQCNVYGNPQNSAQYSGTEYRLNGEVQDYNICWGAPAMYIAVIDSLSLEPWETNHPTQPNPAHNFGNANDPNGFGVCRSGRPDKWFIFRVDVQAELDSMADMLTNDIPDGAYILAYTGIRGKFQSNWTAAQLQAYINLGADSIQNVADDVPYIFFTQKGNANKTKEVVGAGAFDYITFTENLTNNANFGQITSPVLGPTSQWNSLHWKWKPQEGPTADSIAVTIIPMKKDGTAGTKQTFQVDSLDVPNLSDYVDAAKFPYLQLEAALSDDSLQTAPQLLSWHVLFDGVPEAALNAVKGFHFDGDTLPEGKELKFAVDIENVSEFDMDSLRIEYWVENKTKTTYLDYPKQKPLLAGELLFDTVRFATNLSSGFNSFWVDVNPEDSLWQLEQYHFNNIGRLGFFIQRDNVNPILDVTFDGIHILDGDIVSPVSEITISLKDENLFLALDDTSDFEVYITDPNGAQKRIPFIDNKGQENMIFTPAVLPDNSARINYTGDFKLDGTYELLVRASDKSDNRSGVYDEQNDYKISFEVINKSTITEILNYPNPFSTATKFVFTLTGSKLPDVFTIQILTVTGKVVKEITQAELGNIRIGRNISDYTWNGTDDFGDPLANGVYLYRVITRIDGESIEHRSTTADQFFHKGFGKMYLMR